MMGGYPTTHIVCRGGLGACGSSLTHIVPAPNIPLHAHHDAPLHPTPAPLPHINRLNRLIHLDLRLDRPLTTRTPNLNQMFLLQREIKDRARDI